MRVALFGCLCVAVWPAGPARADTRAHYEGYAKGLHLFDLDIAFAFQPGAYRLTAAFRLTGVLGALFHGDGTAAVDGRFDGPAARPRQVMSAGQFRGDPHVLQMDWDRGQPRVLQMIPPAEPDREAVPAAQQAGAVDVLSAVAAMLHTAADTGRCETEARTFDGIRLSEFSARTGATEMLEPTGRSSYAGPALRCEVTGRMVAGFVRDTDQEAARRPKQGTAWFAHAGPDQAFIPVRIVIYTKGKPSATLYLATPGPAAP